MCNCLKFRIHGSSAAGLLLATARTRKYIKPNNIPERITSAMSCTYCYKGFALPGEPKGTIVGQDYFTAAPNDATQRTKAIVLLTDIFGLPLPNPRIIADHLAEHVGVDVWVPDYFNGASLVVGIDTAVFGAVVAS